MEPKVSMCLFAHRTERFLSQLIRWGGLTGWLLSLLFALSGLRAVLPPTEKARRAVGKPIAPSTVAPTSVPLALPIAPRFLDWNKSRPHCNRSSPRADKLNRFRSKV